MIERPLIAITTSDDPDGAQAAKIAAYAEAVRAAGGEPYLCHPASPTLRPGTSGILFSGGRDLDPRLYGEERGPDVDEPDEERDALEQRLFELAEREDLPLLGICRGLQALNVFRGGRLVRHLDGHRDERVAAHPLHLVPDSRLRAILGADRIEVNSYHHQAVVEAGLGRGLRVAGTADGLVEAFEDPARRFFVAVQCHPERPDRTTTRERFAPLFAAFVAAARERAALMAAGPSAGVPKMGEA